MLLAERYTAFTQWIVALSPGADKFAHSYAGLAIWLLASVLLRGGRQSLTPLALLTVAELTNELLDRVSYGSWRWPDTLGDVAATLFWPALLTALLRWTGWASGPAAYRRRHDERPIHSFKGQGTD